MANEITQWDLRNNSGDVMRGLDQGDTYTVTRNGIPVGELRPIRSNKFVRTDILQSVFSNLETIDFDQFRDDLDSVIDPYV